MAKNRYKVCSCKEEFSEVRVCCPGCGKSGLTANESDAVLTNINESLPFLTPSQNAKRRQIEKKIQENAGNKRLMEAYQALGLNEEQAKIASNVEERLRSEDIDFLKEIDFSR
jgi:hypothetical protein